MTAELQLHWAPPVPLSMTMSPSLPVHLSLHDLVPSCGKFPVGKSTINFYLMNGNIILEHVSLLPGTHSQDWNMHFTSPSPIVSTFTIEAHSGDQVPEAIGSYLDL